nr:MAG TPA: hypothetical protein [Caudoviricetes sp.]
MRHIKMIPFSVSFCSFYYIKRFIFSIKYNFSKLSIFFWLIKIRYFIIFYIIFLYKYYVYPSLKAFS